MKNWLSDLLDVVSSYFANRKGALIIYGILLIVINWIVSIFIPESFLGYTNSFLHLGLILSLVGVLLKWIL